MEERVEVGVGLEEGTGVDRLMEGMLNIPFPSLGALNTFADYHRMETASRCIEMPLWLVKSGN